MKIFGITGWSGSGKTTLIERMLPLLAARGFVVGALKRAHHDFDIDRPGKDSRRYRDAGCREVAVVSARRRARIYECAENETEPELAEILSGFNPACNLILVEGYKRAPLPKLEVWREALARPPVALSYPNVAALAADGAPPDLPPNCALLPLNDAEKVAGFIAERAQ
ncbi:MAG: molybdopterin-guanine dinucleotide biosynthesis protein B [Gammaproteobacteria bacterium]